MNILFLHGMASSHESATAEFIRKYLPEATVWAPDLSIDPEKAFPQIDRFLAEYQVDLIIGHSLGGFMAQKYRGRKKILLNPSLGMTYMYMFQGDNKYKEGRADGNQIWHVDKRMCDIYKDMERKQYDNLTPEEDALTIGMFGRKDFMTRMAAHWFKQHYSNRIFMPGGHYPPEESIRDYVVPQIRSFLNE
ncbi:MAG: alpha/beta fold hydrolase [Paludibacteraceae bacterium]|nr:alpha/beta fold hydrolase [Paludibacteraceae bacterium]